MYSSWNSAPRPPQTARRQAETAARFYTDQLAAGGTLTQVAADRLADALAPLIERRLNESPKFKLSLVCDRDGARGLLAELLLEAVGQHDLAAQVLDETGAARHANETSAQALARVCRFKRQMTGQLVIDDRTIEAYDRSALEPRLIFGGGNRPLLEPVDPGPAAAPPSPEPGVAGPGL